MAAVLDVPLEAVQRWLEGREPVPSHVFLRAVDWVLDGAPDRKPLLLLPVVRHLAKEALAEALVLHRTALGNVQLMNPRGKLEIVAQSGFGREFLDFFREVGIEHACACGAALERRTQVIVDDVLNDPIFAGTRAAEVMLRAGARAVQSTPVVAASGRPFGMISTHLYSAGAASGLPSLEPICRRLAESLDQLPERLACRPY
jgi:hypothetical protein